MTPTGTDDRRLSRRRFLGLLGLGGGTLAVAGGPRPFGAAAVAVPVPVMPAIASRSPSPLHGHRRGGTVPHIPNSRPVASVDGSNDVV
jgi:hypothetical protein